MLFFSQENYTASRANHKCIIYNQFLSNSTRREMEAKQQESQQQQQQLRRNAVELIRRVRPEWLREWVRGEEGVWAGESQAAPLSPKAYLFLQHPAHWLGSDTHS